MDFTFGIITTNKNNLNKIIQSIYDLNIPKESYEIIIVGDCYYDLNIFKNMNINCIPFDESIKHAWITRKKNIIIENAKFENIVMCHDYIIFDKNWYTGFLTFGNNWDWCICKIQNTDGTRFRDYTFFPYFSWWNDIQTKLNNKCLIPYDYPNNSKMNKFMYISGTFYLVKKNVALMYPLDENRSWGQGEDVLLSLRLLNTNNIIIKCNPNSSIFFTKYKEQHQPYFNTECTEEELNKFNNELNQLDESYFTKNFIFYF